MIKYRKGGYKYQLAEDCRTLVGKHLCTSIDEVRGFVSCPFVKLYRGGALEIQAGYAWDGPSGPTIDTLNFMEGSMVHDALYQLIRAKLIPNVDDIERHAADAELEHHNKAAGMSWLRRKWVNLGVRTFASFAADPANKRKVITTP